MAATIAPTKQILMSDMLANNEQVGRRYFKVGIQATEALDQTLLKALSSLNETNQLVLNELRLMNARIEEAFETKINIEDVSNADSGY